MDRVSESLLRMKLNKTSSTIDIYISKLDSFRKNGRPTNIMSELLRQNYRLAKLSGKVLSDKVFIRQTYPTNLVGKFIRPFYPANLIRGKEWNSRIRPGKPYLLWQTCYGGRGRREFVQERALWFRPVHPGEVIITGLCLLSILIVYGYGYYCLTSLNTGRSPAAAIVRSRACARTILLYVLGRAY